MLNSEQARARLSLVLVLLSTLITCKCVLFLTGANTIPLSFFLCKLLLPFHNSDHNNFAIVSLSLLFALLPLPDLSF